MVGILVLAVSHHLPTFCVIQGNVHKKTYPRKIVRDTKNFNVEGFCEDVSSKLASMFKKSGDDPNLDITNFLNIITETANKYAPFRTLCRKQMKLKTKPWLTKGLLNSITAKNKLFQQCYKQQNKI